MKNQSTHIDFLDALRAVAILGVLICHTYAEVYGYGHEFSEWKGWYRTFASNANYWLYPFSLGRGGVALFFVISGFCIHISFQQSEKSWGRFYIRRFFRLYPAYILALIFVMLMLFMRHLPEAIHQGFFWNQFSTHALFIHNFFSDTFKGTNPALWSLAVEAQLYLLYPVLLFTVGKMGWRTTLLILAGLEVTLQAAAGWTGMTGAGGPALGHVLEIAGNTPLGYWFSWAMGAVIADAYLKKQALPFLKIHPLCWLGLAVLVDFIKPLQPFWFTAFALCGAALISRCLNAVKPPIVGSLKFLTVIGLWSYSIYLLHYPMLEVYNNLVDWYFPQSHQSPLIFLALMFGTWLSIIPLAGLWYKVIELPGIALGKRLLKKPDDGQRSPADAKKKPRSPQKPVMATPAYYVMLGLLVILVAGNFKAGAQFAPTAPSEFAGMAWSLATNADATKRNGALAVKYAEKACRQTGFSQSAFVGILAAAYAEDGRFNDAISAAQYASNLAAQNGDNNTLQMNRSLLQLYMNHQAYHANGAAGN